MKINSLLCAQLPFIELGMSANYSISSSSETVTPYNKLLVKNEGMTFSNNEVILPYSGYIECSFSMRYSSPSGVGVQGYINDKQIFNTVMNTTSSSGTYSYQTYNSIGHAIKVKENDKFLIKFSFDKGSIIVANGSDLYTRCLIKYISID